MKKRSKKLCCRAMRIEKLLPRELMAVDLAGLLRSGNLYFGERQDGVVLSVFQYPLIASIVTSPSSAGRGDLLLAMRGYVFHLTYN